MQSSSHYVKPQCSKDKGCYLNYVIFKNWYQLKIYGKESLFPIYKKSAKRKIKRQIATEKYKYVIQKKKKMHILKRKRLLRKITRINGSQLKTVMMPVTPALGRWRQKEHHKFGASLISWTSSTAAKTMNWDLVSKPLQQTQAVPVTSNCPK